MKRLLLILVLAAGPAVSDEISDGLQDALKAYQEGDLKEATEVVDYVAKLLKEKNANRLTVFLPDAPSGWKRQLVDTATISGALIGLGQDGTAASAKYTNENGKTVSYTIMADSPMMAMMGAVLSNPALMGNAGKTMRIKRQNVLLDDDGVLQSMVYNRFVIRISPDNSGVGEDILVQLFETTDFDGLKDF
jgi:hypothetical protein